MKLEIKHKVDEPLLLRQRIEGELTFNGPVPSREDVKKDIAAQIKSQANLVEVRHIYNSFGTGNAKVLAFAYKDNKIFELLKKSKGNKKKAAAGAEGAEKKEEAKPQEKPKK